VGETPNVIFTIAGGDMGLLCFQCARLLYQEEKQRLMALHEDPNDATKVVRRLGGKRQLRPEESMRMTPAYWECDRETHDPLPGHKHKEKYVQTRAKILALN
jgi:hypothetical protein